MKLIQILVLVGILICTWASALRLKRVECRLANLSPMCDLSITE